LKTYRPLRKVLAEIQRLIATDKPSARAPFALVRILKSLCEGRNYARVVVVLLVNGRETPRVFSGPQGAAEQSGAELSVPIKIAGRTLGSLRVQLPPGREFSPEERVLLHEVAENLAVYLSGKGKYVVRKAREAFRETAFSDSIETRRYQPSSDWSVLESRRAVAGDQSRP
jgi:hypothetical protein